MIKVTENVATLSLHIGKLTLQRDYAQAIEAANVAIMAYPECAGLYAQRSSLYIIVERDDLAIKDLDSAVELDPTSPHRYLQRAAYFLAVHEYMEALQDCYEALRLAPGNHHALCSIDTVQQLMIEQ